jgi:hypothetical protein
MQQGPEGGNVWTSSSQIRDNGHPVSASWGSHQFCGKNGIVILSHQQEALLLLPPRGLLGVSAPLVQSLLCLCRIQFPCIHNFLIWSSIFGPHQSAHLWNLCSTVGFGGSNYHSTLLVSQGVTVQEKVSGSRGGAVETPCSCSCFTSREHPGDF